MSMHLQCPQIVCDTLNVPLLNAISLSQKKKINQAREKSFKYFIQVGYLSPEFIDFLEQ